MSAKEYEKRIIRIPKNPSKKEVAFFTEIPIELLERVDSDEWEATIEGLNYTISSQEQPSVWSFLKNIFILPSLFEIKTYDKKVRKYLREINSRLKVNGVFIEDPSLNGYTELEIILQD
ncbi:hypothetical protein GINT2_000115 [Glugoides intestinalis]